MSEQGPVKLACFACVAKESKPGDGSGKGDPSGLFVRQVIPLPSPNRA